MKKNYWYILTLIGIITLLLLTEGSLKNIFYIGMPEAHTYEFDIDPDTCTIKIKGNGYTTGPHAGDTVYEDKKYDDVDVELMEKIKKCEGNYVVDISHNLLVKKLGYITSKASTTGELKFRGYVGSGEGKVDFVVRFLWKMPKFQTSGYRIIKYKEFSLTAKKQEFENCNSMDGYYCLNKTTVEIRDYYCKTGYGIDDKCIKGYCEYNVIDTFKCEEGYLCVDGKCKKATCEDFGYSSTPPTCEKGYYPETININDMTCYTGKCIKEEKINVIPIIVIALLISVITVFIVLIIKRIKRG